MESAREQLTKVGKLTTLADIRAKQAGKTPSSAIARPDIAEIAPEFPYPLQYLWDYFLEICCAVPHDDHGAPQILWTEILAWSKLVQVDLEPWETTALTVISRISQKIAAEAFNAHMKQKTNG